MILDALYALIDGTSSSETLTVTDSTDFATGVFDLQAANINNGGGDVFLNINCLAASGSLTADKDLTITVYHNSAVAMSTGNQVIGTVIRNTNGTGYPAIAAGQWLKIQLPKDCQRYIKAVSVVETGLGGAKTATFKIFLSTT